MAYAEQTWQDGEAGGTPLSAARLNHMEDGIDAAHVEVDARGELAYAQVTASQTGITSEVDLSGLSVTVDIPANRRIRISAKVQWGGDGVNNTRAELRIKEDGVTIQTDRTGLTTATYGILASPTTAIVRTPTAASHTYKLTGQSGSGSIDMGASTEVPAYILVEDLGPA